MTLIDDNTIQNMADLFSALSDPSRLRILALLIEEERSVSSIAGLLGMTDSAVSHQLNRLRLLRIVQSRKSGRQVFYCLDDEHVANLFQQSLKHMEHA